MIKNGINGFFMAIANSIPGVSGGTIAYILGFYDQLLSSINNLFSKNKIEKKNSIVFLIQLFIGMVIGMVLSIIVLSSLFTKHIYFMSSLLIGLTIASIPLIFLEELDIFKTNFKNIIKYILIFIIGFLIVIYISSNGTSTNSSVINLSKLNLTLSLKLFIAGLLGVATMILPGISGSSLMVIFKLYIPIINAVNEILHLNFSYLPSIIIFGLGIIIGAVTTVKLVRIALSKFRAETLSFIFGLIIAAVYSIILGPTSLEIPQNPLSFSTFNVIAFAFGVIIILLLHRIQKNKEY